MKPLWHRFAVPASSSLMQQTVSTMAMDGPQDYLELAAVLIDYWLKKRVRIVGLSGGQGSGKSTLSKLLIEAGRSLGIKVGVLHIDDFYLSKRQRLDLASEVNSLFETRGPPGTHDIAWLTRAVDSWLAGVSCEVPNFDKGLDDRVSVQSFEGDSQLLVIEGWCVGATSVPAQRWFQDGGLNELEKVEDRNGNWRRLQNESLNGIYAKCFSRLENIAFLAVPGIDAVRRWRMQQELDRPQERRFSQDALERFVQHYESVTLWMLEDMPLRVNVVIKLNDDHKVSAIAFRDL